MELDNQYSWDILNTKMFLFSQSKIFNRDGKCFIEMQVNNRYHAICKEYSEREEECTLFFYVEVNPVPIAPKPDDAVEVL